MATGRPRVERVPVTCACCGAEFEKQPSDVRRNKSGRFFCSAACRNKVGSKPRQRERRQCKWCEGDFYPEQVDALFCTKDCYDAWQRRHRVDRVCEVCGKTFDRPPSFESRQKARFCSRSCEAASRIKRPLEREHNGKPAVLDQHGYVRVYEPSHPGSTKGGWISEHRLVAEQTLERRLDSSEHVHHMNGKKDDNRPKNLMVISHGDHSMLTGKENGRRLREWAEYRKRFGPLE